MEPLEYILVGVLAGGLVTWVGTRIDRNEAHHEADELRADLEEMQRAATFYRQKAFQ